MELDNIKKLWTEIDTLKDKQHINEERIKEILKDKQKTALSKLTNLAGFGVIIGVPLCVLFYYLFARDFFDAGGFYAILASIFSLFCLAGFWVEGYKYRFLKKIDLSKMTIKDIFDKILKYERFIQREKTLGIIFLIVFFGTYVYLERLLVYGTGLLLSEIFLAIILISLGAVVVAVAYRILYRKLIEQIKQSLKELEEFEEN